MNLCYTKCFDIGLVWQTSLSTLQLSWPKDRNLNFFYFFSWAKSFVAPRPPPTTARGRPPLRWFFIEITKKQKLSESKKCNVITTAKSCQLNQVSRTYIQTSWSGWLCWGGVVSSIEGILKLLLKLRKTSKRCIWHIFRTYRLNFWAGLQVW